MTAEQQAAQSPEQDKRSVGVLKRRRVGTVVGRFMLEVLIMALHRRSYRNTLKAVVQYNGSVSMIWPVYGSLCTVGIYGRFSQFTSFSYYIMKIYMRICVRGSTKNSQNFHIATNKCSLAMLNDHVHSK